MPGQKNPLLDLKVRQAMWHAIDHRDDQEARDARQVPQYRHPRRAAGPRLCEGQRQLPRPTITTKAKTAPRRGRLSERLQDQAELPERPLHQRRADLRRDRVHVDAASGSRPSFRPSPARPTSRGRIAASSTCRWSAGRRCRRWTGSACCRRFSLTAEGRLRRLQLRALTPIRKIEELTRKAARRTRRDRSAARCWSRR